MMNCRENVMVQDNRYSRVCVRVEEEKIIQHYVLTTFMNNSCRGGNNVTIQFERVGGEWQHFTSVQFNRFLKPYCLSPTELLW